MFSIQTSTYQALLARAKRRLHCLAPCALTHFDSNQTRRVFLAGETLSWDNQKVVCWRTNHSKHAHATTR